MNAGAHVGGHVDAKSEDIAGNITIGTALKPTFVVGGTAGYQFDLGGTNGAIRTEIEGAWSKQKTNTDVGVEADWGITRVYGNVWYEFNTNGRFRPYVGGGAGYAFLNNVDTDIGFSLGDESGFIYQFGGGVQTDLTPDGRFYGGFGYRYMGYRSKLDEDLTSPITVNILGRGHRLMFEGGYRFGR